MLSGAMELYHNAQHQLRTVSKWMTSTYCLEVISRSALVLTSNSLMDDSQYATTKRFPPHCSRTENLMVSLGGLDGRW